MKIAVISDLHLGAGDACDWFGHDEGQFLGFLRFLEDNFERVVLLGDIWETLTSRRRGDAVGGLKVAREAHSAIARRFERSNYHYVHGNHDLVAGSAEGVPDRWLLDAGGARVLFTHGHHHDLLISKARWLSEFGVWVGGWTRRAGLDPLYRAFRGLERLSESNSGNDQRFRRWALDVARDYRADIVVTGHTHRAQCHEEGPRVFLNSGSCQEGRFSFSALDTARGTFGVHGFEP
ncbi:MAG: metallophosphoesterase family protein [Polyangiaceae bacterium]